MFFAAPLIYKKLIYKSSYNSPTPARSQPSMSQSRKIADYLKEHPDFFAEHPDLLAAMNAPEAPLATPAHGRIHDRRELALRERQERQQTRMESMLDTARSNQDLADELHQIAVSLLSADKSKDLKDPAVPGLLVKSRFDIDEVAIFLSSEQQDFPPQVDYAHLCQRVAHFGSVCDDRVSSKLGAALFPHAAAIASCAFIPLAHRQKLHGVMVLGCVDRERFQPGMGALILDRLGQLIGAYLAGHGLV